MEPGGIIDLANKTVDEMSLKNVQMYHAPKLEGEDDDSIAIYTKARDKHPLRDFEIERLSRDKNSLKRHGIKLTEGDDKITLEIEDWGTTWKDIAESAFSGHQSSGYAPTLDTLEDRCQALGKYKNCALDVLGMPLPDDADE